MDFKWFVPVAMAVAILLAIGPATLAQDAPEPQDPPPADAGSGDDPATPPAAEPEPETKKKATNRLYLEAAYGQFSIDDLGTSLETTSSTRSISTFSIDDNDAGRIAIGWGLSKDRGRIVLRYETYNEQSYSSNILGNQARVLNPVTGLPVSTAASSGLPWWNVTISPDGQHSVRTPQYWNPATDDANGNGVPDPDEVVAGMPNVDATATAPSTLENRTAVIDAFYWRSFGGRRWSGEWSVGLRSFQYQGNVVMGAWIQNDVVGAGFPDGNVVRLIGMSQDTSGFGPSASLGLRETFFRERLQLYQRGRAAFVTQSLSTDSGDFFTLVRDTIQGVFLTSNARIGLDIDKSSWQTGLDLGLRIMLVEGFHLDMSYSLSAFQDVVLLPTELSIPETTAQLNQGTSAVYTTQDLTYSGWFAGLSFQF